MFRAFVRVAVGMTVAVIVLVRIQSCQTRPNFDPISDEDFRNGGNLDPDIVELGRFLFFDEEMSGNRNISCATCHHPLFATTDALSLSVGEGGEGLGPARNTGSGPSRVRARVARNAPALFNLGAHQFRSLFHDGRVAVDPGAPSGFSTPVGDDLPDGLYSVVAAQALIPLTLATEMAGQPGENEVGDAAHRRRIAGEGGVWDLLVQRLRTIPVYVSLFAAAFDDVDSAEDITIVHAANALAAFVESAFRSDESPFDRYLRGDASALTPAQVRGMNLFYGGGGRCARCHAGPFQTDQRFHALGMPQIGPGTGGSEDGRSDFGRENVSGDPADRYRFRTPSLRNVELTGPWGHSGAYGSLEAMMGHYRNQNTGLAGYDRSQAILPSGPELNQWDFIVMNDPARVAEIVASSEAQSLQLTQLSSKQIADLVAFLKALTDPRARNLSGVIPESVPSGHMTKQGPDVLQDR